MYLDTVRVRLMRAVHDDAHLLSSVLVVVVVAA